MSPVASSSASRGSVPSSVLMVRMGSVCPPDCSGFMSYVAAATPSCSSRVPFSTFMKVWSSPAISMESSSSAFSMTRSAIPLDCRLGRFNVSERLFFTTSLGEWQDDPEHQRAEQHPEDAEYLQVDEQRVLPRRER